MQPESEWAQGIVVAMFEVQLLKNPLQIDFLLCIWYIIDYQY